MLGLVDYLLASGITVDVNSTKVHLACLNRVTGVDPLDAYFAGNFKAWQEWQTKRNFKCTHVVGLIDLGQSNWLFVGVYEVLGCSSRKDDSNRFIYSTKLLPRQSELIGRIVVHHKRTRTSYIWYKPGVELPIVEIRRKKMTIGEFPGHNAVAISHEQLCIIVKQKIPTWHGALSNVKGIYLITDTSTGKQYVGKASGDVGIWQRWCSYAKNGHGGNKELKQLLKDKGPEHMTHLQFSILEIADSHASEKDILARESHWMKVLQTRDFGLN